MGQLIKKSLPLNWFYLLLFLLCFTTTATATGKISDQAPNITGRLLNRVKQNSFQAFCSMRPPLQCCTSSTGVNSGSENPLALPALRIRDGLIFRTARDKEILTRKGDDQTGKFTKTILRDTSNSEDPGYGTGNSGSSPQVTQRLELPELHDAYKVELFRNQNSSTLAKLKRAEALSYTSQVAGMAFLQSIDAWETGQRPFAHWRSNLHRAWTSPPDWDDDDIGYNYIGHPYTGAFTYNLMRSQQASPLVSWLFSCSQSLIWEYTIESLEDHPSIQDLLITSNVGSLVGEGFHRVTMKMKKNGFTLPERIIISVINPGYVLNNGYK